MKKKVTAIIAAAGSGKRMGSKTPKLFIKIAKRHILFHTLDTFERSKSIDNIVLVVSKNTLRKAKRLTKKYKKLKSIVAGGSTRAKSVYNGLRVCNNAGIVLVHDAARPFIRENLIKRCVAAAHKGNNCLAAVPVKDTIKNINLKNKLVSSTPERRTLWQAQTPQVFDKRTLVKAYQKSGKMAWRFKDEASLAEACGVKVKVVQGDYSNIKITTREDLKIAEALLELKA